MTGLTMKRFQNNFSVASFTWLFVLISFPWQLLKANSCNSAYSQSGHVLLNHVIQTFNDVTSSFDCVEKCAANSACNSINLYTDRGLCELNNATHLSSPVDLVPTNHHASYKIYFLHPLAVCSNQFCSDPDICLMNSDGMSYRCQKCSTPLGMQDGRIPNAQITASSVFSSLSLGAYNSWDGRLYNTLNAGSWSARKIAAGQYLQIDLGNVTSISKVATQGRHGIEQWVSKFSLMYSLDGVDWISYKYGQSVKEFQGNADKHSVVTNKLQFSIKTRYIRIVVLQWSGYISMRAELYGCTTP